MFGTPALWHDFVFKLPFYLFYSAHLHALKICAPLQCRSFCHASCFTSIHHLNLSADTRSIYQIWSTAIGSGIELASYHLIVPSKSLSGHEIPSTFFLHIWLRLRLFFPPFQQPLSLTSNRPSYQSSTLCTDRGRCHGSITGMCQASLKKAMLLWSGCFGACQRAPVYFGWILVVFKFYTFCVF